MNRPQRILFVILATLTCVVATPRSDAQEIRYEFTEGEKLLFEMMQNMTITFQAEGLPERMIQNEQLTQMIWQVEEVKEDGAGRIAQTIDRIKMSVKTAPNETFEYDSASDEELTGSTANQVAPVFKALVGAEFDVTMSRRGEILEVQVPETVVEAMQKVPNAARMGEMFSKEGFEKMVQQGSLTFPEGELEVGQEWSTTFEMENPNFGGTQTITTNYRYLGQEEVEGEQLDAFAVSITMDFGEGKAAAGAQVTIKNQESTGKMYFDREAGHMRSSTIDMTLDMVISAFNQTMTSQLKQHVEVNVKPAE